MPFCKHPTNIAFVDSAMGYLTREINGQPWALSIGLHPTEDESLDPFPDEVQRQEALRSDAEPSVLAAEDSDASGWPAHSHSIP